MLFEEDNLIKFNGTTLTGLIKNIDISASAIVDELEVEGKGKKPKQAIGFEDASINIDIILLDDIKGKTKEEKLTSLQNLFKQSNQKIPNVYSIVNKHINQRNIYKVILKDFSSKETNKKDEISVTIGLIEYEAITVKVKSNKTKITNNGNIGTGNSTYTHNNPVYESYLQLRGQPPKKQVRPTKYENKYGASLVSRITKSPIYDLLK